MARRKRSLRLAVMAVLLVMAAAILAGCFGPSTTPDDSEATSSQRAPAPLGPWVQVITDPAGDANRSATTTTDDLTPCMTAPSVPGATTCELRRPWTDSEASHVGPSAGPEWDLLGVSIQDSARSLRLRFEMASVGEDLSVLANASAGEGTTFVLSWPTSGPCTAIAMLEVYPGVGIRAIAYMVLFCDSPAEGEQAPAAPRSCEAPICLWPIDIETEPGTPGGIILDVPRHLFSGGDPNEPIGDLFASVAILRYRTGTTGTFSAEGAVDFWNLAPSGGYRSPIDDATSEAGSTYVYSSPWDDPVPDLTPVTPHILAEPTSPDANDRRSLVLAVDLVVDAADVVLDVTLDEVAEAPQGHRLEVIAVIGPQIMGAGYTVQDGERSPFAVHIARPGADALYIPVDIKVEPGRPGHVVFRIDRGNMAPIENGAVLGGMQVASYLGSFTEYIPTGSTSVREYEGALMSFLIPESRRKVAVPLAATVTAPGVRLADPPGDVVAPADLTKSSSGYDLLAVDISSPDPDRLQFSLAVADLSDLSQPDGYDAVFYGIGVEHSHGRTMLGYYRSDDRPGGEFLCAPDVTVLPDAPADPTLTGWEIIPGRILDSNAAVAPNAASSGSALVLFAPRSCFALADTDTALNVTDVAAGSYLIRRAPVNAAGGTDVVALDRLEDGGAFEIAFAQAQQAQAARTSFWAQPFGVDNFWDILGVAIAVAFALISAVIIVRKRMRMKRYLVRLEDLADQFHDDAERYAQELVSLRKHLYRDLLTNRLTEGHFVMVEERLRSSLSGTRINAFGHAFYDLPPALMIRLQALLADGRFSRHDHAVLTGLVTKLKIPARSRKSVHAQLDLWAQQDADVARLAKSHKERRRKQTALRRGG